MHYKNKIFFVIFFFFWACGQESLKINSIFDKSYLPVKIFSSAYNDFCLFEDSCAAEFPAGNAILYLKFPSAVKIYALKIDFFDKTLEKIDKISVFSRHKLMVFKGDSIKIADSTDFLLIFFSAKKQNLIGVIPDSGMVWRLNLFGCLDTLKIKSVNLFKSPSKRYETVRYLPYHQNGKNKEIPVLDKNIVFRNDTAKESFFLNGKGYFIATQKTATAFRFWVGNWQKKEVKKHKISLQTSYLFYNFLPQKTLFKKVTGKVEIYDNHLIFNDLNIFFKLKGYELTEVSAMDTNMIFDIRYATEKNFAHQKLYPCGDCYLRYDVALDLLQVSKELQQKGYRLVVHDCYRPFSVQKIMWEKVHNKNFVAPPSTGSSHNRGTAVDVSLAYANGKYLDMGTDYDYFGIEAFPGYENLPDSVIAHRKLLQEIMFKHNFRPIKTEWWHFFHLKTNFYPVLDYPLPCKK